MIKTLICLKFKKAKYFNLVLREDLNTCGSEADVANKQESFGTFSEQ